MVHSCHAVTGGPATYTHVPAEFLEKHEVQLPIWVPRTEATYGGYGQVSNAKAIAAGLTFRPLATTIADLLSWFRTPARGAPVNAARGDDAGQGNRRAESLARAGLTTARAVRWNRSVRTPMAAQVAVGEAQLQRDDAPGVVAFERDAAGRIVGHEPVA